MTALKGAIIDIIIGVANLRSNLRLGKFLQFFKDLNSEPKQQKQLLALNKALGKGETYQGDLPDRIFKEFEKLFNEV